ncbi:acyltransferase family protein [Paraburkholderia xenovorans LB400]|uniref:Acyltransferase n=1 Tax=Paraburkholderia xenovorans (strain LB400) TaxID=266265 RepID=Q13G47_PARXL|nr:acyltransferase [Paraburkholderia xenovorans]ABE36942.1 Putative acyltransferase [Paraburkholderia xenovorans LB400]AIP35148.1 acyltransferase family protein [Paraburkholderia xenovorans LB400]
MKKLRGIEATRGFAAVYVFLHHLNPFRGTRIEPLFHFGQEAVILFFMISGFVIFLSVTKDKRPGIRSYLVSRAVRIYPIFLVSLALAALAALVTHDTACINTPGLLGNLFMMQDSGALKAGVLFETFCRNDPLWSLSYEVWFYVAFALIFFCVNATWSSRRAIVIVLSVVGAVTYDIHPNAVSLYAGYFIIWWAGVELAREFRARARFSVTAQLPMFLGIGVCTLIWSVPVIKAVAAHATVISGISPALQVRHFVMALLVLGLATANFRAPKATAPLIGFFAWIAGISYGLYVTHQPVITIVHALDFPRHVEIVVCVFAALTTAYVLERVFQPFVVGFIRGRSLRGQATRIT